MCTRTLTRVRAAVYEKETVRTYSCRQVGADLRVRAVPTRVHMRTRETGGVPIYNDDIIVDYLRFRVDNRKFS